VRASQANSPYGSGGTETGWVHRNDVTQNNQKKRGNKLEKLKIVEEHGVDIIDMTCLWKICATI